jgi:hypothetical protein
MPTNTDLSSTNSPYGGGGKGNFASFPIADVVLSPQVYEILQAAERRVHEKDKAFVGTKEWMDWVTGVSVRR